MTDFNRALADVPSLLRAHGALVLIAQASNVLEGLPADRLALPAEETARIERYRKEEDRRARYAAHGLLRHCLGQYLCCAPADIHLVRQESGRPSLPKVEALDFNLSHSGAWIAVGLCLGGKIGVDVQDGLATFDWTSLGEAYLCATEIATIGGLPIAQQARAALELWCLKEAFLKATGEGLSVLPHQIAPRRQENTWRLTRGGYELCAASLFLDDVASASGSCAAWASNIAAPLVLTLSP